MFHKTRDNCASFDSKELLTSVFLVAFPFVLSCLFFPAIIWVAALNMYSTYLVFICFICICFYAKSICKSYNFASRYFFAWTITSMFYVWYGSINLSIWEIEYELNIWITFLAFFSCYITRCLGVDHPEKNPEHLKPEQYDLLTSDLYDILHSDDDEKGKASGSKNQSERIIDDWDRYCIWLDCPVNSANRTFYLLALLLTAFALYYTVNVSMLRVCQPIIWFRISDLNFLLPSNCKGVYNDMESATYFVRCIYAYVVAIGCSMASIKHLIQLWLLRSDEKRK